MKRESLPLGVDVGSMRLRVVCAERDEHGVNVRALASRDIPPGAVNEGVICDSEYVAALLEDAVRETGTRERRCISVLGPPASVMFELSLPPMTGLEREKTAKLEASRRITFPPESACVRLRSSDGAAKWILGIARSEAVRSHIACIRAARLRLRAIDDKRFAFRRAYPRSAAVLDIGARRSVLYVGSSFEPVEIERGGVDITDGVGEDLLLDPSIAEKRKRIVGTSGAGERAFRDFIACVASAVEGAQQQHSLSDLSITGNGSRLPTLHQEIEAATGVPCRGAYSWTLRSSAYPEDFMRSAAPDFSLAAALAHWKAA